MSLEENKNKVLIMRQRNGCLDQDLDEIELAIEAVNAEILSELNRLVTILDKDSDDVVSVIIFCQTKMDEKVDSAITAVKKPNKIVDCKF